MPSRSRYAHEFPHIAVSFSSEVQPEIREYERASTTAANAYAQPITREYLGRLTRGLASEGFAGQFHVMLSSGGLTDADVASAMPIKILESGPAAGVEAARFLGSCIGIDTLVSFDMGGTTAKIGLIAHGAPTLSSQLEVARLHRFKTGSGLIVKSPTVELIEIGAGGGSIARIDQHGLLKVGPDSAGADPGPVCYRRGGRQLTVTDANLVLGYLDPDDFAGKEMTLDIRARAALPRRLRPSLLSRQLRLRGACTKLRMRTWRPLLAFISSNAAKIRRRLRLSHSAAPVRCTRRVSRKSSG